MRTVAALYVDPRGPYPTMPGVDCWDEARDARKYDGPHPVVAHPPCGAWGRWAHLYKGGDKALAMIAVGQVRRFGGALEHPAQSRLWAESDLPPPAGGHDEFGGYTIAVNQVSWGHCCVKPTWLYMVGIRGALMRAGLRTGGEATHGIWYGRFELSGHAGPKLLGASKEKRRRTPPLFAEWLVSLARASRVNP